MADLKISELTNLTAADPANDMIPIVDVSATPPASGSTKRISINNILACSPTATLASATISGDLTVDTSTLKVDSANNTVGIGNATPPVGASNTDIGLALGAVGTVRSVLLGMQNCFGRIRERDAVNNLAITTNIGATGTIDDNTRSSWKIRIGSGNENYVLQRAGIGSSTFQDLLAIDSGGVCVWSDGAGGTRMTLNSTGLGLGGIAAGLERFVVFSGASKMMSIDTNGTFFADGGTGKGRVTLENSSATNSILSTTTLFGAYNILKTAASQHQWFLGGSTQAMTLDASGNLLVGTTTNTNVSRIFSRGTATSSALALQGASGDVALAQLTVGKFDNNTTTSQIFVRFTINDNSSGSGQINANGASQAAFGTFSDSRLKENIVSLPSQLANILSLRPVEFDYKDGSGHQIGFVAQEMQEVYSDAVGEQNGFLTVTGWSKTEARLVSAMKELAAKVQALEAKLA